MELPFSTHYTTPVRNILIAAALLQGCLCGPVASTTDLRSAQLEQSSDGGVIRLSTAAECDASASGFVVKLGQSLEPGRWGTAEKRGTLQWCEAGRCSLVTDAKSWSVELSGTAPNEQVTYSISQSATFQQNVVSSNLPAKRCP